MNIITRSAHGMPVTRQSYPSRRREALCTVLHARHASHLHGRFINNHAASPYAAPFRPLLPTVQPPVAVLTGPPGSGKTATINALANELDLEVLEWITPTQHSNWDTNANGAQRPLTAQSPCPPHSAAPAAA